jgi:putative Holliday junction resolvase
LKREFKLSNPFIFAPVSRILSIDYGAKRCGLAETDDLQLIASPLETISRRQLFPFLDKYLKHHQVTTVVLGEAVRMSGEMSEVEKEITDFLKTFHQRYPKVKVVRINEAYTSKMAVQAMIEAGSKRKDRRKKENIDKIAATIILQDFLEQKRNQRQT